MRAAWTDPKKRENMLAGMKKAAADPKVLKKRLRNLRKATRHPLFRARKKAASENMWKDPAFVRRHAIATIKAKQRLLGLAGGRPRKTEVFAKGAELRKKDRSWPDIAKNLTPAAFHEDPRKAAETMRKGVTGWLQKESRAV